MAMENLLKALVKAKAEFTPIPKDKQGPRSRYSSLDAVLSSVEPALLANGLAIVQATKADADRFYLETTLFHISGESISATYPLLTGGDSQKTGSSLTYARRYSICSLLSVVADEDDDGAAASPSSRPAKAPKPAPNPLEEQVSEIIKYGMENGLDVADIKSLCRANNLPDTKAGYTNPAQVTTLAQLIENQIAEDIIPTED